MYLPDEIPDAKVLIIVKTYPLPSSTYSELVCTAGLIDGEKWIRIYPVPFRLLEDERQYPKYSWVNIHLKKNKNDFRSESYRPLIGANEDISVIDKLGTANQWAERKKFVLKEVFTSVNTLIELSKAPEYKSLAVLKPKKILDFVIEEDEKDWKPEWLEQLKQQNLFGVSSCHQKPVRKLPYKFFYKFISEGDEKVRKMMIEDWEIGALYWNCLRHADGNEQIAKEKVRQKYFDTFVAEKDIYLLLGTTLKHHRTSHNPFTIIGVFYPPKSQQFSLL